MARSSRSRSGSAMFFTISALLPPKLNTVFPSTTVACDRASALLVTRREAPSSTIVSTSSLKSMIVSLPSKVPKISVNSKLSRPPPSTLPQEERP